MPETLEYETRVYKVNSIWYAEVRPKGWDIWQSIKPTGFLFERSARRRVKRNVCQRIAQTKEQSNHENAAESAPIRIIGPNNCRKDSK